MNKRITSWVLAVALPVVSLSLAACGRTAESVTSGAGDPSCTTTTHPWSDETVSSYFNATVVELNGTGVTVCPAAGTPEARSTNRIAFDRENLTDMEVAVGDTVRIGYNGYILESYPGIIHALSWSKVE